MGFSAKISLGRHLKEDGTRCVYLIAIIDRMMTRVPLGFYLEEKFFDTKNRRVKSSHPNADTYNMELVMALTKANNIGSKFRIQGKRLTTSSFRNEYLNPPDEIDVLKYMRRELSLRTDFEENTVKSHNTVINKLEQFQKRIPFADIDHNFIQRFKNFMIKAENKTSSIDKVLKVVKHYLDDARKKGTNVEDPFKHIKIKTHKSNRMSLSEAEVLRLDAYYESNSCSSPHKKLLRYFLFSCYTGLRISDIARITWNNIHDDLLIYIPYKTKNSNLQVTVPLTLEKKYLPEFRPGKEPIFDTFSDPVSNRYLKEIIQVESVSIKRNITYHTARHTFASLMAEGGHLPETQKMLGHGNIKTTMEYVHTNTKALIEAKTKRFKNTEKESPSNLSPAE